MGRTRADQPVADDRQSGQSPEDTRLEASRTLLAAADSQPQTWSRNDGGRYYDVAQNAPNNPGNQWVDVPTVGGATVRFDPRGQFVDIYGPNRESLGRTRLEPGQPTPLRIGNQEIYANPNGTVDARTQNGGFERTYPGGMKENFQKVGDKYVIQDRKFPDGSYEKYADGKLQETNHKGFITRFDAAGHKTDVSTPNGDKYHFKYGANGKVDSYELSKRNEKGENQVVERASRGSDGNLKVERRQADGTMKVDERLKGRADVALRADLKLDYLDKDGYGMPDSTGRMIKRDDRTVMIQANGADGRPVAHPVNPIRSIRYADGRQTDYQYSADRDRAQGRQTGDDGLSSYTIRDRNGKVVEFAQKIPDIPGTERRNSTAWFEFKAKPGESLPEDKVAQVKRLMQSADPSLPPEEAQMQMMANRAELMKTRPMSEFMPTVKGQETTNVAIDQLSGRQFNQYANGEVRGRNERGLEFKPSYDQNTGSRYETYNDGTTYKRTWDADPRIHPLHRTTVTRANADGINRIELHHSRRDNSFINVNYDKDGRVPQDIIVTPPGAQPVRMAPDASNPNTWNEYSRDGNGWKPTGRSFPMRVDMLGKDSHVTLDGQAVPPGSLVISQGDKRRLITPGGEEFLGTVGRTPTEIVADPQKAYPNPEFPNRPQQGDRRPPGWTQQIPQQRPDRRAQPGQPQVQPQDDPRRRVPPVRR